jgi:hypothetical protein
MDTSADSSEPAASASRAHKRDATRVGSAAADGKSEKKARHHEAGDEPPLPTVTLDDAADAELLSDLSYDQAKQLKHADVVCALSGSEVRRWKASEVIADDATETFSVQLHEWPRIRVKVKSNRLHKHSSLVPSV